jgi:hypothetical protein
MSSLSRFLAYCSTLVGNQTQQDMPNLLWPVMKVHFLLLFSKQNSVRPQTVNVIGILVLLPGTPEAILSMALGT